MLEEKVVLENYKIVKEKSPTTIPSVNEVKDKIIYNIDAKCYDLIYSLKESMVKEEEIAKILMKNNLIFAYEGKIWNPVQIGILDH